MTPEQETLLAQVDAGIAALARGVAEAVLKQDAIDPLFDWFNRRGRLRETCAPMRRSLCEAMEIRARFVERVR